MKLVASRDLRSRPITVKQTSLYIDIGSASFF